MTRYNQPNDVKSAIKNLEDRVKAVERTQVGPISLTDKTALRTLAAPANLVITSTSHIDENGRTYASVKATWDAVTEATFGTPLEVSGYELWARPQTVDGTWRRLTASTDTTAEYTPMPAGSTWIFRVRAIGAAATAPGEWSAEIIEMMAADTTAPTTPTAPILTTSTGVIYAEWDGQPTMPSDFLRVELGMGSEPGTPVGSLVVVGYLSAKGQIPIPEQPYEQLRYFRFRARDMAGNYSAWSDENSIATSPSVDADAIQEQIDTAMSGLSADLSGLSADVDVLNSDLSTLSTELSTLDTQVSGLNNDITNLNTTLSSHSVRMSGLDSDIDSLNVELTGLSADLNTLDSEISGYSSTLSTHTQQISGLNAELTGLSSDLNTLDTELSGLSQDLYALDAELSGVSASVGEASGKYTLSTSAPIVGDGSGKAVGSYWIQYNSTTNREIARWRWTGSAWQSLTIEGNNIAADSLTADQIATNAITAVELAAESVLASSMTANSITATAIAASAITAGKIAASAVVAGTIAANAVTANTIAASAVIAGKIAASAVVAGTIAASAVTANTIAASAVTAGKIAASAVVAGTIAANAVTASTIAANVISSREILASSIVASNIAGNTISAAQIAASTITANEIAASAITAGKIAASAVVAGTIAANAVTANAIAASAVTAGKIGADAVVAGTVAADTISTREIVASSIVASNIAALSISGDHIQANAVNADKIDAGSIRTAIITSDLFVGREFSGGTFTGATIRTAILGRRVVIDRDQGITALNDEDEIVFTLSNTTGAMEMFGNMRQVMSNYIMDVGPKPFAGQTSPGILFDSTQYPGSRGGIFYWHGNDGLSTGSMWFMGRQTDYSLTGPGIMQIADNGRVQMAAPSMSPYNDGSVVSATADGSLWLGTSRSHIYLSSENASWSTVSSIAFNLSTGGSSQYILKQNEFEIGKTGSTGSITSYEGANVMRLRAPGDTASEGGLNLITGGTFTMGPGTDVSTTVPTIFTNGQGGWYIGTPDKAKLHSSGTNQEDMNLTAPGTIYINGNKFSGSKIMLQAERNSAATAAASSFVTVGYPTLNYNIGGGGWNGSVYTVPVTGMYLITAQIRIADTQAARSFGQSVGISNVDNPFFIWSEMGGTTATTKRDTAQFTRIMYCVAGNQLRHYIYSDGVTFPINNAAMTITLLFEY